MTVGFAAFFGLVVLLFLSILTVVLVAAVRSAQTSRANRRAPLQHLSATVVGKRNEVRGGSGESAASTRYFATFQLPDGTRQEFGITGPQSGQLVEGDTGRLQVQGSAFRSFSRAVR